MVPTRPAPTRDAPLLVCLLLGLACGLAGAQLASGGTQLVYELDLRSDDAGLRDAVLGTVRARLEAGGIENADVVPVTLARFAVRLPTRDTAVLDRVKRLVADPGRLEFRITVEQDADEFERCFRLFQRDLEQGAKEEDARLLEPQELSAADRARHPHGLRWHRIVPDAPEALQKRAARDAAGRAWMLVRLDPHNLSGADLLDISVHPDDRWDSYWCVNFRVEKDRQRAMSALTEKVDEYLAIVINDAVHSAPVLKCQLTDSAQISASFTEEEAYTLAAILQAGALEQVPRLVSEIEIPPAQAKRD